MNLGKYLEIHFVDGGRDFSGCDCYGLIRLIYFHELGIDLPEFCGIGSKETLKIRNAVRDSKGSECCWKRIDSDFKVGDVVLLKMNGAPIHVGMMLDSKKFIHISEKVDCSIDSLSSSRWRTRIDGIYRHQNGQMHNISSSILV